MLRRIVKSDCNQAATRIAHPDWLIHRPINSCTEPERDAMKRSLRLVSR